MFPMGRHPQEEVVRFDRVGLDYNGQPLLHAIHYTIYSGEFYFLTGPSGAGKTSLLKLINRELGPTQGTVHVFGQDVHSLHLNDLPAFRQRIGLVLPDCHLLAHLTALDNVALPLKIKGMDVSKARLHAQEMLGWVGLGDQRLYKPTQLSEGEKQRVAIARAMVTRPALLLVDEPAGNVDDDAFFNMVSLLEELHAMGTTILFATHRRILVESTPHPELCIQNGALQAYYPDETSYPLPVG
jgi:cell division transport system ATP-binding protein